jgi:5-(aminomethyl)-3-furanmethanol phosphate kinase
MPFHIIKLGGSLIGSAKALVEKLSALEGRDILIIPGGGPMADLVHEIYCHQGLSQEAAHWMAILAMEQYGYMLADGTGAKLTREIARPKGVEVLLPYQALLECDQGIEHSWEYTSDSVAALVACRIGIDFIKATNVEGIILEGEVVDEISADALLGIETCVDQGTLRLLKRFSRSCRVLNGADPDRFVSAIEKGTGGTLIIG